MISILIAILRLSVLGVIGFVCEPGRLVFEPGGFVCEPLAPLDAQGAPPMYVERVCVVTTTAGALVEVRESPGRSTTRRDELFCATDVVTLNERVMAGLGAVPFDSDDA